MDFARMEVEAAVAAGVIQNFDPNSLQYQCVVCSRAGCGDVLPHILSKEHKNSLIWEAIRQSPPSKALLNQMPDVVRAAKLNEEVGAVDKNHFSYRCNICYGKKPFNGVAPLEAHLRGKEHEKSKRNMQYTTHCARTVGEPVQVTAPMQKGSFHLSSFANQTSEYGIPNARASPPEADQHVHAPTPTAGAWLGIPHPPLLSPTDLQRERGGLTMPKTFDSMGKESLSPEAVEAIHSGIVSTSNGLSYYCNACQVPLTGARPLVQHVEGERHKKTARMTLYRQEFPNIAGLTLSPDPKTRLNNPSIVPPADKKTALADRKGELQDIWQASYDTRVFSQRSTHSPWQDNYNMTAPTLWNTHSPQQNNFDSMAPSLKSSLPSQEDNYDTTVPSLKTLHTPKQDSYDTMTDSLRHTHSSLPFDPGQQVLIDLSCGKRKVPAIPWDGPYIVQAADETDENVCWVQKVNGKSKKVAWEHCIPYSPQVIHDVNMHQQSEEKVESAIPDSMFDTKGRFTAVSRSEKLLEPQSDPCVETTNLSSVFKEGTVYKRLPALSNLSATSSLHNSPEKSMTQTTVVLSEDGGEIFVYYVDEQCTRLWKPSKVFHTRGTQTDVKPAVLTNAYVQTENRMAPVRRRR
ncbi:uncharacterized protein [Procambarus clarkii]|uniref:uncharacterized protein isoform X5 n=1 Tax=Procambarus clarkii TaxID=6728 RepID=UPI0037445ECD